MFGLTVIAAMLLVVVGFGFMVWSVPLSRVDPERARAVWLTAALTTVLLTAAGLGLIVLIGVFARAMGGADDRGPGDVGLLELLADVGPYAAPLALAMMTAAITRRLHRRGG